MQQNNNYNNHDDFTSGSSFTVGSDFTSGNFNHFTASSRFSPFSIARAVMAASFAAPLASKLHWRNIVFHVYGLTPEQETAVLSLAMSIWGNPRELIFNYSDGRDALAHNAELLCHLPMAIRSSSSSGSRNASGSHNFSGSRDADVDVYAKKKELKKKQAKQLQSAKERLEPQEFNQLKKQLNKQLIP